MVQDSEKLNYIEEITVTATKKEQGLYDVPVALTTLEGDSLPDQGIDDLVNVGKYVPNLTVTTFAAGHTSSANPFIRGIGTQDHLITTDPGVGVCVDGVYLGRQVGQHWNLSNIERVEVLRGPQGTLYGRNSIGGAINIVTYEPGRLNERRFTARVGQLGRKETSLLIDEQMSDTFAFSVQAALRQRCGVGKFLNLPQSTVDVGEFQDKTLRFKLGWQPSPNLSVSISADSNEGDNSINPYTTLIDEVPYGAVFATGYRNSDISKDPYDNNTGAIDHIATRNAAEGFAISIDWYATDRVTATLIGSKRSSDYSAGLDDDSFFDDFLRLPEVGFADQKSLELQIHGKNPRSDLVIGAITLVRTEEINKAPLSF